MSLISRRRSRLIMGGDVAEQRDRPHAIATASDFFGERLPTIAVPGSSDQEEGPTPLDAMKNGMGAFLERTSARVGNQ